MAMFAQAEEAQAAGKKFIIHAEALQEAAEKTQRLSQAVLATVPAEVRKGAREGAREVLQKATVVAVEGLNEVATSLRAAAAEGRASAKVLRRTGIMQGIFLLAVVVVMGFVGWVWVESLIKNRKEELAMLRNAVARERDALAELKSQTWGLELVEVEGQRVIILPKGVKYGHSGPIQDGSGRIGIVIKR